MVGLDTSFSPIIQISCAKADNNSVYTYNSDFVYTRLISYSKIHNKISFVRSPSVNGLKRVKFYVDKRKGACDLHIPTCIHIYVFIAGCQE